MTMLWLVVSVLLVTGAVFWFLVDWGSRRAMVWGMLWALPLGFWFVTPEFFRANHVQPANLREWIVLDLGLSGAFAAVGAFLAYVTCLPLAILGRATRRDPATTRDQITVVVASLLPLAYLACSIVLEWSLLSHPPSKVAYRPLLIWALPLSLGLCVVAYFSDRATWLKRIILAGAVVSVAALPMRVPRGTVTPEQLEALIPRGSSNARTPLLLVGIDSGTWTVLRPLMEKGRLPVLAGLVNAGIHGDMHAAWPPYWSAPAWGAMVTGRSQEEIGVHEDLKAEIPYGPTFEATLTLDPMRDPISAVAFVLSKMGIIRLTLPGRAALHATPIWEQLSHVGVKSALVCFPFTYPAQDQAALVISRRLTTDVWRMAGIRPDFPDSLVSPAREARNWQNWFSPSTGIDQRPLMSILPRLDWPRPKDSVVDPVQQLRDSWDLSTRVLTASAEIVRTHHDLDVVMMYLGGFDTILHTFWQYAYPEDFPEDPPDPADVAALGGVIDRFAEFLDASIGRVIGQFATTPNVIVVSDHGHAAEHNSSLFRGFHAPTGIFIAAGPDIAQRPESIDVSYFDVVPTLLDLESFEIPASLKGRSLVQRPYNPLN